MVNIDKEREARAESKRRILDAAYFWAEQRDLSPAPAKDAWRALTLRIETELGMVAEEARAALDEQNACADDGKTRDARDYVRGPIVMDEQKAGPNDEEITQVWNAMPGGRAGFLTEWGYLQFARALLSKYAAPAPKGEPSRYPCEIIEADFDTGTVLLQMDGRFTASAGPKFLCDAAPVNEQDAKDSADPLQGAADWLVRAITAPTPADIQRHLIIGYNRSRRLYDAAIAQQGKGEGNG